MYHKMFSEALEAFFWIVAFSFTLFAPQLKVKATFIRKEIYS